MDSLIHKKITKRTINIKQDIESFLLDISSNADKKLKKRQKNEIKNYDMDSIKILEVLGEGSFGKVFRAYNKKTGQILAIKYFKETDFNLIADEDLLMRVVEDINKKDKFIRFYGLFKDSGDIGQAQKYILMMESGEINLMNVLTMRKKYEISNVLYILKSLVNDFLDLQNNGIANRDIKPENIILIQDKDNSNVFHYKISDFGIGIHIEIGQNEIKTDYLIGFSSYYAAPEIKQIKQKRKINKNDSIETYDPFKADVYSLGITIIELMGFEKNEFFNTYLNKSNDKFYNLIDKMLKNDYKERINFSQIKNELQQYSEEDFVQPKDEKLYIQKFLDKKKEGKTNDIKINEYLDLFNTYYKTGIYKIANDFLNLCYNDIYLQNQDDKNLKNTITEARLLYEMGRFFHYIKQENENAENFYFKSLKICLELNFHQIAAQNYNNLAIFNLVIKENYNQAEEFYKKSLEIRENMLGVYNLETAQSYNNLGIFNLQVKQDFLKTEEYFLKSLDIHEKLLGFFHENTAQSYNNLANFYKNIRKSYDKSEEMYKKSLKIREKVLGLFHQDTAQSYNNLAIFYIEIKKDFDKSEEYFFKALNIHEKSLGFFHQLTADSYNNLGNLYKNENKNKEKAEELLMKCLKIKEEIFGVFHNETALSYNNLGDFYSDLEIDYDKAEEYYLKSLEIREKVLVDSHLDFCESYNSLANFYKKKKNLEKTEFFLIKICKLNEKVLGEFNSVIVESYLSLAKFYKDDKKNYNEAEVFYLKCINILEKKNENKNDLVINVYNDLIELYNIIKDDKKIMELNNKIEKINNLIKN